MGDELTKDEVAKALYSLAASDGYAELGRQRVVASHEALRASRDDRDRLLSAANKDRKRIVGIFQEAIGALVANGLDVTEILGRELEEQVHDIVELGQPAKGDTRDELRTSLAASLLEVERLKEDAKYINRVQCECVRARDNADRERDAALARTESAERDSAALRGVLGEVLVESRKTYHLEEDRPDLIARATALAAGPVEEAGHEPGELIAKVTCPCCGASLGVEYGDDEGEIGVVGDPAAPVDDPALKEAVDVLREVLDCRLVLSGSGDQVQAGNLIASNNPSLHSRASALVQRHGGTGGREGGEAMNPTKSYRACENCGRHLSADSPPPPRAYERGEIHIDGGSLVLLPNAVVKEDHVDGYSDSHAANISGAYCDLECLVTRIRNILHVNGDKPRVNKRKAREARR